MALLRHSHEYELDVRREAEALVAAGARCDVLYLGRRGSPWVETRDGVRLRRVPGAKSRGGAGRYLIEYVWFVMAAGFLVTALHLRYRYRVVQANTMPDLVVFAAAGPKLAGARVVAFMQEPTPELARTLGAGTRTVRLLQVLEQRALRFADRSITVTEALKQRFVSRGADPDRITVVLNGSDPAHVLAMAGEAGNGSRRAQLARSGVAGRLVVLCHGTIEDRYGHDTLVDAVALAASEVPGIELVITGRGDGAAALLARIADRGLDERVRFEGWVSEERLAELLGSADVGVVAQKASPYSHLVHTNKMYDYWIAGLPVIASRLEATAADFDEDTVAFFDPGDPADLARVLVRLALSPDDRCRLAAAGRLAYERVGWATEKERYLAVFLELMPELSIGEPGPG